MLDIEQKLAAEYLSLRSEKEKQCHRDMRSQISKYMQMIVCTKKTHQNNGGVITCEAIDELERTSELINDAKILGLDTVLPYKNLIKVTKMFNKNLGSSYHGG